MARWLSNSEARRVQNVVETVERQSVNKLPPQSRTWRPMSRGGSSDDEASPCGTCGPRLNATRIPLPGGLYGAGVYQTTEFNALLGISGVSMVHGSGGIYVSDDITFACP